MTNSISYPNQQFPAYSGVTINITNPALNTAPQYLQERQCMQHTCTSACMHQPYYNPQIAQYPIMANPYMPQAYPQLQVMPDNMNQQVSTMQQTPYPVYPQYAMIHQQIPFTEKPQQSIAVYPESQQAYPSQYYLNNYNYIQNSEKPNSQAETERTVDIVEAQEIPASVEKENNDVEVTPEKTTENKPVISPDAQDKKVEAEEIDMSISENIIKDLEQRVAEEKALEKNGKKTKVVALTNEYIMSLENYLNNPNSEIRLMAAEDILTRLNEDRDRYNDAALNALLNKMLQDPNKNVRIAALSAFASQLASGNDFTVELLQKIQNDPNGDKEDALQAANALLVMSATIEERVISSNNKDVTSEVRNEEGALLKAHQA